MRFFAVLFTVFFSLAACAEDKAQSTAPAYKEGVHYVTLPKAYPVDDPSKIEVAEVFWYGCSHCFHFEPLARTWKAVAPSDVNFVRVPAVWNGLMELHSRMFYAAEELGILDKVHQPIFDAMHPQQPESIVIVKRQPKMFKSFEEIAEFFSEYGVAKDDALKALQAHTVVEKVNAANARARAYQISGTPQLVVHGKYRIETNGNTTQADLFKVADFLVAKIRSEK
ncbi:thiol:disulfide interchange protein DsbA [Aurantivibrio plasticivorans]